MKNIAIITGASSGLGAEFFRQISRRKGLDEIWLIARRREKMEELSKDSPVTAKIYELDLLKRESVAFIENELNKEDLNVSMLVNNAGFGKLGNVDTSVPDEQMDMVRLNCEALTGVTSAVLKHMQSGSKIINVCSIAAFAPNPRMTVYSATKSYVMFFSRSLRFELKDKGINVTALCPGPMSTEFLSVANIPGNSKAFDKTLPYDNPESAVRQALKGADKNKPAVTPKGFYRFYRFIAKITPKEIMMHASKT